MKKKQSNFISEGNWYKGNLHCHTTYSDGNRSSAEIIEIYKQNGYHFLCISDHNIYNYHNALNTKGLLLLPSIERSVFVTGEVAKCFHIVGIGCDPEYVDSTYKDGEMFQEPCWENLETTQNIINDLNSHNNLSIIAHPVWSRNELSELSHLKDYIGIEIYNNVCELIWHQGYSELYWDLLLKRGLKIWGFASDDAHDPAHTCGGWIIVKAKGLTNADIRDSILRGSFYSSTGPEIYEFYLIGNQAVVNCSPAKAIHFITYDNLGKSFYSDKNELSECAYTLQGPEKFVRVEIVAENGKKAWSNPIFLR